MVPYFLSLSTNLPIPALYFITGELPVESKVHRDVFSFFYNLLKNKVTRVFQIVKHLMETSPPNSRTWSVHIKHLSKMYGLQSPLDLIIQDIPKKHSFKKDVITSIRSNHEAELRSKAETNGKMKYLNVSTIGLDGRPHLIHNVKTTTEVRKLRPILKMLTCDYYTYETNASFSGGSPHCRLCSTKDDKHNNNDNDNEDYTEDIEHIVAKCDAMSDIRQKCLKLLSQINQIVRL